MSIYISRATQKLYVRRATHKKWSDGGELYDFSQEFPVTIKDPDKPIGTHIFTAVARDGGGLRWTEVSIDNGDNAKDALDRITFPQEVLDKIAPTAVPLSSIIISDEPLSSETNYRTEFVAVLNNQPQGGFITRAPSPKVNIARDDGGFFGHFGGWFGSSGYNQLRRRRPADSRPAACRIIRGSDADGAIGERVAFEIGDPSSFEYFIASRVEVEVDCDRFGLVGTEILRSWRSSRVTASGKRAVATNIDRSSSTDTRPRSNIQWMVPDSASPLRTESDPPAATGRICAACTSARPPPLMICNPVIAHVFTYAALTDTANAASRKGRATTISTTGRSNSLASSSICKFGVNFCERWKSVSIIV